MGIVAFLLRNWMLVLVAGLLAVVGVQTVRLSHAHAETETVKRQFSEFVAQRTAQHEKDQESARATEQQLQARAAQIQEQSHETERVLRARVDVLRGELRNRPDRPVDTRSGQAATAGTPAASGTGAGLYRPDGEFLAGEAAAAARIASERDACRAQYESADEALKQYESTLE